MESLGINIKLLIAQLINFALFFYIFKKFIARPFSQFLKSEIQKGKEKDRILEEIKNKEEKIILEEKKLKERIKQEYESAIKAAKQEAARVKEQLINEAKIEADRLVAQGKRQIEEEREIMNKKMKEKIADLSLMIIHQGLIQFLPTDIQSKITQQVLKNLKNDRLKI